MNPLTPILILLTVAMTFFTFEIVRDVRGADNSSTTTITNDCLDKFGSNLTAQQECVKNTPVINGCNNTQTVGPFTTFFNNISGCPVKVLRVALIEPTFTYAAYRSGSFYNFYEKYSLTDRTNKTVTTDLNLLKDRPIPHGPFPYFAHPSYSDIPYINYFRIVLDHVKNKDPLVTNLTDVDVDQGKIFRPNEKNAYDVLVLFHNEYATQSEYNNLRQFVNNGGTILFTDANVFFAEVSYNKVFDSITLVKGHYWKLDSNGATPSISERWLNESREWMGSNFFDVDSNLNVKFRNNPFNYTHSEEQYVTNPKAKILVDYKAYDIPNKNFQNATVATYQMNYGNGRVINLGIWGHIVEDNKAFLEYFDNVILPLALGV